MANLKMRSYRYSRAKAAIFERKGSGFTSYGHGFCLARNEVSAAEELLKGVLKFDPMLQRCAERQIKLLEK
jgi:hypothetical protein